MFTILAIFYSAWLLLTCLYQFQNVRMQTFLSKIDIFRLLPIWTFFAPNPGVSDYHLLYRIRYVGGRISDFKNLDVTAGKSIKNAVWNPHKRVHKSLNDFVQEIRKTINTSDIDETNQYVLKLSFGYIVILNYCTELGRRVSDAESVQFMILESFGHFELREPRLILNSDFHNILS
jgi:hypothetical protein